MSEPAPTIVTGEVTDVVFENEDTGYAVLRIRPDRDSTWLTLTGVLFGLEVGARIRAEGKIVKHDKYGSQLNVARYEEQRPSSTKGMVAYLRSQFEGVGEKLAAKIVDHFGEKTYEVLDADPDRIGEVSGVGKKKALSIAKAWHGRRAMREAITFLQGYGVPPGQVVKLFRHYGDNTVPLVKTNPYRLADEVVGIGFKTADRIAGSLGLPKDSPDRARAAVLYLLAEAGGQGHLMLPEEEVVRRARSLGIQEAAIRSILELLVEERDLYREAAPPGGDASRVVAPGARWDRRGPALYLPRAYLDERSVAQILTEQIALPDVLEDPADAVDRAAKRVGLELGDQQRSAVILALTSRVSIITGGPGVGKTTIVRLLVDLLRARDAEVLLAAPTGRAAKRLSEATHREAKTIHRMLGFDPMTREFLHHEDEPLEVDHLVVDECSMVDVGLAAALLAALPPDAGLTLVGDADQLPSVGPGDFFRAVCAQEQIPVTRLDQVFRQRDGSRIVEGAHRINGGQLPVFDPPGAGGEFFFVEREDPEQVAEVITTLVSSRIEAAYGFDPLLDVQVLTPMHKGAAGAENLNRVLGAALNPTPPSTLERGGKTWRVGDRVVCVKNDYEKNVFNGDLGFLIAIDTKNTKLVVRVDGRDVDFGFDDLNLLLPAWATTVHRAQGGEHKAIVLALTTQHQPMLQRNLLYTAVTRARNLCVIVGSARALARAVANGSQSDRCSWLEERLRASAKAAAAGALGVDHAGERRSGADEP